LVFLLLEPQLIMGLRWT